jgi:hypothetical protein
MIGPAPMIMMVAISVRFGMGSVQFLAAAPAAPVSKCSVAHGHPSALDSISLSRAARFNCAQNRLA